jgi:hypothetical protein
MLAGFFGLLVGAIVGRGVRWTRAGLVSLMVAALTASALAAFSFELDVEWHTDHKFARRNLAALRKLTPDERTTLRWEWATAAGVATLGAGLIAARFFPRDG